VVVDPDCGSTPASKAAVRAESRIIHTRLLQWEASPPRRLDLVGSCEGLPLTPAVWASSLLVGLELRQTTPPHHGGKWQRRQDRCRQRGFLTSAAFAQTVMAARACCCSTRTPAPHDEDS
jgi:hypothetical protein